MIVWRQNEAGWWQLVDTDDVTAPALAAVCREATEPTPWCVYIDEDMPPGDSQHRTLREAKAEAERRVGCE